MGWKSYGVGVLIPLEENVLLLIYTKMTTCPILCTAVENSSLKLMCRNVLQDYYDIFTETVRTVMSQKGKVGTGRARLIRSHSSARFCFELSANSN